MTASFISGVRSIHSGLMSAAMWMSWVGAACLLHPRARALAAGWCDALESADARSIKRAVTLGGIVVAGWFAFLKACQYRGFQLLEDSVVMVNTAASFVHGRGLECVTDGTPTALSVHFAFFIPVFLGPILLLWKSALPLVLIQGAAVASCGPAAYFIAWRRTQSRTLGLVAMFLAWSHWSFHELVACDLENSVYGPPLFLWGLVLWDEGIRVGTALLWGLALTTREQFPFTLAGLGVYHALSSGKRTRGWAEGAGIVVGAAAVWAIEMHIVAGRSYNVNSSYWGMYSQFGTTKSEVIKTLFTRPDRVLLFVVWPPTRLAHYGRLILDMALLPLADPAAFACLLVASFHHLLQSTIYIHTQNASYTYGPLVFAMACGLRAVSRHFGSDSGVRTWIVAAALLAVGVSLSDASRVIHPSLNTEMTATAPPLLRLIPADASVWADEYAAMWLSARSQLKTLRFTGVRDRFDVLLFRPEYVLAQKITLAALTPPTDKGRVIGFLAREGYQKVAESGNLVLLKDPLAPRNASSPELQLPARPDDTARATAYLASLFDSPETRTRLAAYPPDLRVDPHNAEEHAALAQAFAERGLVGPAVEQGKAALALSPDLPEAHNNLGNALAMQGELAAAEANLRAAVRLRPHEGLMAYNLGNILIMERKPEDAIAILEQAVLDKPDDARIQNSLGAAYLLVHRRDEARQAFTRALALDPNLADARENLAAASR